METTHCNVKLLFICMHPLCWIPHGGATTIGLDATHPPTICQNLPGGELGRGGGGGVGGRGGGNGQLSGGGVPKGGVGCDPLLPDAYLKGVCVRLGAWGYRGMYAIIAISRLCQEESLTGLKDQRHSTPLN